MIWLRELRERRESAGDRDRDKSREEGGAGAAGGRSSRWEGGAIITRGVAADRHVKHTTRLSACAGGGVGYRRVLGSWGMRTAATALFLIPPTRRLHFFIVSGGGGVCVCVCACMAVAVAVAVAAVAVAVVLPERWQRAGESGRCRRKLGARRWRWRCHAHTV